MDFFRENVLKTHQRATPCTAFSPRIEKPSPVPQQQTTSQPGPKYVEYVFVACLLSGACLRQNETVLCWSVCGYGRISSREFAHPHKEARLRAHADCTTTISQGQYYLVDRVGSGSNRGDLSRNFDPAGWSCFPKKRNTAIMLCVLPN
eukprot:COSAG06_NODE_7059_length_2652_cov_3.164904_2_plen_148_part_00